MGNIWHIISKPDNIPIVGLIILVFFFSWLSLSQAFKNDRLEEGER